MQLDGHLNIDSILIPLDLKELTSMHSAWTCTILQRSRGIEMWSWIKVAIQWDVCKPLNCVTSLSVWQRLLWGNYRPRKSELVMGAVWWLRHGPKLQWNPVWLAQLYPKNDWTVWQCRVSYGVCAQALFESNVWSFLFVKVAMPSHTCNVHYLAWSREIRKFPLINGC